MQHDRAISSFMKYYEHGRRGTMYPDLAWGPKQSFRALAED